MLIEDLYRAPWHERMRGVIKNMIGSTMTEQEILANEITEWLSSETRQKMITGEEYYLNKTAIEQKVQEFSWKSNRRLSHGYAKKLVDQKVGYLLSKEPTFAADDENYKQILQDYFHAGQLRRIKNMGKEAINKGIGYLHPHFNDEGELSFTKFPSEQIIPFWTDNEHVGLNSFIRVYEVSEYMNGEKVFVTKVEFYHEGGIEYYIFEKGELTPDVLAGIGRDYHFTVNGIGYLWDKIPLIHFKYNEEEQPLIDSIKSLVDNYNMQASTNADLLADIPNFIYKLVNYGGQDLDEFLDHLNRYRAVSLEEGGDVDKLQSNIETEAVEKEIERNRNSIYEFGRGVDTKGDNLQNASGVALRFRYSDLDMDCNILETEFQSSVKHMLWFINHAMLLTGKGDYTNEAVNIIFNRDVIMAETEAVENCEKSIGILDDKTIRQNHPWYNDEVEERLKQQRKAEQREIEGYSDTFDLNE